MNLTHTILPASEAVSLKEVKDYLRIEHDDEDGQLVTMIYAATARVEKYLNRALITQTFKYTFDRFPSKDKIKLMYGPIQSITSIIYTITNGTSETFDSSNYYLANDNLNPAISLGYNKIWPSLVLMPNEAVSITYIAGYGDTSDDVPTNIKQALLNVVANMYENRETGSILTNCIKESISDQKVYTF